MRKTDSIIKGLRKIETLNEAHGTVLGKYDEASWSFLFGGLENRRSEVARLTRGSPVYFWWDEQQRGTNTTLEKPRGEDRNQSRSDDHIHDSFFLPLVKPHHSIIVELDG